MSTRQAPGALESLQEPVQKPRVVNNAAAPFSETLPAVTALTEPSGLAGADSTAELTGIRIGYARVSTGGQKVDRQVDALRAARCRRIFADKQSGKDTDRAELRAALEFLEPGNTLVVPALDRLSPVAAGPDHHRRGSAPPRGRVHLAARGPGHHHPRRTAGVPRFRCAGRVHPRAHRRRDPRGPGRGPRARPHRRPSHRRQPHMPRRPARPSPSSPIRRRTAASRGSR